MLSIGVRSNFNEIERQFQQIRNAFTRPVRAAELMAEILERETKQNFDRGGTKQENWIGTDEWWAEHMAGKRGHKALVWSGYGQESVKGVAQGNRAIVYAASYLHKFQFGPWEFDETFQATTSDRNDDGWEKLPEGEVGFEMRRHIKIHQRTVADVFDEDVAMLMEALAQEAGLA